MEQTGVCIQYIHICIYNLLSIITRIHYLTYHCKAELYGADLAAEIHPIKVGNNGVADTTKMIFFFLPKLGSGSHFQITHLPHSTQRLYRLDINRIAFVTKYHTNYFIFIQ